MALSRLSCSRWGNGKDCCRWGSARWGHHARKQWNGWRASGLNREEKGKEASGKGKGGGKQERRRHAGNVKEEAGRKGRGSSREETEKLGGERDGQQGGISSAGASTSVAARARQVHLHVWQHELGRCIYKCGSDNPPWGFDAPQQCVIKKNFKKGFKRHIWRPSLP
eukprot:354085-Chlamydomonas_euryale.AAC.1